MTKESFSTNNTYPGHKFKDICNGFGCINKQTEKIEVRAGTFGTILLYLCDECITKFQPFQKNSGFDT
ncbi:hypothetical protein NMY3_02668 [Candidatus Nitrosocosmicus oleophilus]|uniref:Uncharacterized protein n=1 Tax=Candidatus Nitrosocosmicus oleophilus TaxID=1353260 RepID=A0A654LZI4_9ARCH|nr:hypothetical protein [Candidatus Nitrosocosmicus oleophilus]ALI36858.1 hypothetical protein NMY3_02668 [Candidatus Nitrosocosmicus oleophilus]